MPIWSPGRHIPTQKIPKCPPPRAVAVALPGKRRSALVFKQKFDLILVLRLSEVSIREHNLSSTDSAAAATKNKKRSEAAICSAVFTFEIDLPSWNYDFTVADDMKAELVNFFLNFYSFFLVLNRATTSENESNSSNFKWDPRGYVFYCPCMGKNYILILIIIKLLRT